MGHFGLGGSEQGEGEVEERSKRRETPDISETAKMPWLEALVTLSLPIRSLKPSIFVDKKVERRSQVTKLSAFVPRPWTGS